MSNAISRRTALKTSLLLSGGLVVLGTMEVLDSESVVAAGKSGSALVGIVRNTSASTVSIDVGGEIVEVDVPVGTPLYSGGSGFARSPEALVLGDRVAAEGYSEGGVFRATRVGSVLTAARIEIDEASLVSARSLGEGERVGTVGAVVDVGGLPDYGKVGIGDLPSGKSFEAIVWIQPETTSVHILKIA